MDQFSAHLDRGWDLAQRGDAAGAELSARRALELDGQSPEAHNLLGYVSALQGNFDEAIEHYAQAIALDDTRSTFTRWASSRVPRSCAIRPPSSPRTTTNGWTLCS
jgi:Tfp pilus assembly protein PilF